MKQKLKANQEANYDFYQKRSPEVTMGQGSFANMPEKPIITTFSGQHEHRDGITNSFTCDVNLVADVDENRKY
jgi:hypothetical protein